MFYSFRYLISLASNECVPEPNALFPIVGLSGTVHYCLDADAENGNMLTAGFTRFWMENDDWTYFQMFSSMGRLLYSKYVYYPGNRSGYVKECIITRDGNKDLVFVGGANFDPERFYVIKTDYNGVLKWSIMFKNTATETNYRMSYDYVTPDVDGALYISNRA